MITTCAKMFTWLCHERKSMTQEPSGNEAASSVNDVILRSFESAQCGRTYSFTFLRWENSVTIRLLLRYDLLGRILKSTKYSNLKANRLYLRVCNRFIETRESVIFMSVLLLICGKIMKNSWILWMSQWLFDELNKIS